MSPRRGAVFFGVLLAWVLTGCGPSDPAAELLVRATESRVVEPRWSGDRPHRPCDVSAAGERGRCAAPGAGPEVSRWIGLVNEVEAEAQGADSAVTALRALAAVDVVTAGDGTADLDRAIARLRVAAEIAPGDADVRNDLAVALLVRGASTGDTWDRTEALEALEEALRIDPEHRAAAFNRALALDRLNLGGEAIRAWERVAADTTEGGWAAEARVRRDAVTRRIEADPAPVPQVDGLIRDMAAMVASGAPTDRSAAGWASVRRQAEELAARGERGALDLVEALEEGNGSPDPRLAEALARYVEAMDLWRSGAFESSEPVYRRAHALADGPSAGARALRWRAEIGASRGRLYGFDFDGAEAGFGRVEVEARGARAAETRGHALWGLGLSTGRRGDYAAARRHHDVADSLFASLGQREQYGSIRSLKAELLAAYGATGDALDELVAALPLFGRDGGTMHQNLLSIAGRMVATRHPRAATAFHREGLVLSEGRVNPQYRVEALIRLAQAEARVGETERVAERLDEARAGIADIEDAPMRTRVRAEHDELVGMYVPGLAAEERDALLTAAVTYFDTTRYAFKVPGLLERRGRHRLDAGRIEEARADFRRALAMTELQLAGERNPARRASLIDAKADAVDALVGSHLAVGDTLAALLDVDRARAASSARTRGFWDAPAEDRLVVDDGFVVVTYAEVGPRVLAWVIGPEGVGLVELPVPSEELRRSVARLRFLLRSGAPVDAVASLTQSLHGALIRPLMPFIGDAARLTVVPDGPLHGLPFSVLGDTPGAILEDYGIAHAPSVAFALSSYDGSGEGGAILAATAGTGTAPQYAGLPVLRYADDEAAAVAALHRADVLPDPSADELAASLEQAGLFHFAGHGLFRSDRPDLSELVLPGEAGGLPASRIATLDLSRLELAVLAACSTQEADDGRSGGLSGLTWSFLEAGAGGVIGSLWAVPDEATSDLMVRLHERLAAGEHPAEALRAVQLAAAREGQGGWGWTAFRYEGSAGR